MRPGESMAEWIARLDAKEARLQSTQHVVYRAFDEHGLLLYIGCTVNLEQRMGQHRSLSKWAVFADSITTEEFASKNEARAAEKQAINSEASYFNATQADIQRTQANRHAAERALYSLGIVKPHLAFEDYEDEHLYDVYASESDAYDSLKWEMRAALKAGAFPYLTDEDRLDNYLAARARAERGAA